MAPRRKRPFGSSTTVLLLLLSLPLVGIPLTAHAADLGEEPSKGTSKSDVSAQAEDPDRPKDPSLLQKKPADAAVAQKKQAELGPPFYERWQFWAITGGVVVGTIALIFAGKAIAHQVSGGDVRPCNPDFVQCGGGQ